MLLILGIFLAFVAATGTVLFDDRFSADTRPRREDDDFFNLDDDLPRADVEAVAALEESK